MSAAWALLVLAPLIGSALDIVAEQLAERIREDRALARTAR